MTELINYDTVYRTASATPGLLKIREFRPLLNKVNNGFSIVFSNLARKGFGFFSQTRNLFFSSKWLVSSH